MLDHDATLDPRSEAVADGAGHEDIPAVRRALPERCQKVLWYTDILGPKRRHMRL
jgi:hypothetical protein